MLNQVASAQTPICEEEVKLGGANSVQLVPEKNINAIVPKNYKDKNIIIEKDIPESVTAPVEKGEVIGKATVYYKGSEAKGRQKLAEVNLVASEKVERSGLLYALDVLYNLVSAWWFMLVIGVIILLLVIYLIVSAVIRRRSRRRKRNVRRYRNF